MRVNVSNCQPQTAFEVGNEPADNCTRHKRANGPEDSAIVFGPTARLEAKQQRKLFVIHATFNVCVNG